MTVMCVDDEYLIAEEVAAQCKKLPAVSEAVSFTAARDALAWLDTHETDVALLDIDMPEMDGIQLAAAIKEKRPDTAIIFLTAFSQYAVTAFTMHVSGYLLKPVDQERLKEEFAYAMAGRQQAENAHVQVKTFGGFDLFVDGEQVTFRKAKSKELLAFLVDKQGSSVTRAEAFAALWEDRDYDRSMQKQFDVVIRILRDTLREYGIEDIFSLKRGTMRIVPAKFSCDAYRFYKGDAEAVRDFRGEYMSAYDWASMTEGYLTWKKNGDAGER